MNKIYKEITEKLKKETEKIEAEIVEENAVVVTEIMERKMNDYKLDVYAKMSDGSTCIVVSYYDDELSFTDEELIGLTESQCRALFFKKDREYLQS